MRAFKQSALLPATLNDSTTFDLSGLHPSYPVYFQLAGTFTAQYTFEVSADGGTTWQVATTFLSLLGGAAPTLPLTAPTFLFTKQALPLLRVRCTTAGTAAMLSIYGQDTRAN